eukprot:c29213_g1_i1 orf=82-489(+)
MRCADNKGSCHVKLHSFRVLYQTRVSRMKGKGPLSRLSFETMLNALHNSHGEQALEETLGMLSGPLKPFDVEEVLKHMKNAQHAMWLFKWAGKQHGYKHDTDVFNAYIAVLGSARKLDVVWEIVEQMHQERCALN